MSERHAIAIVGMGGVFPGARDLARFWDHIVAGRNLAKEPPEGRWLLSLEDAYDPHVGALDKVYSKKACFIEDDAFNAERDLLATLPEDCPIPVDLLRQLDPLYHLLLHAGRQAFAHAGAAGWDRARMGVIVGNLALPTDTSSALAWEILGRAFEEKVIGETTGDRQTHPLNRYVTGLPAGVLAKCLGLGGACFTLDAACASSLYALRLAAEELRTGRADAMLAGGVARPDSLYTQMGFSQLRALSPTGTCAPFDAAGDGLVVGEGAGVFVLKRLDDALRDGDTIHAVIRGMGLSNDVGGRLLAPTSEGQLRAMRVAYEEAGWKASDVDLVECHATGTPVGDAVEFESLCQLWADESARPGACVIGSVKSNIGHLLTGAGAAAMMKVLLALKHGTLPPTANFTRPQEDLRLDESPFRVLAAPETWPRRDKAPRRAGISAFGFGGINAHILVEEWTGAPEKLPLPVELAPDPPADIAVVGMEAHFGPWETLRAFQERVLGGNPPEEPHAPRAWWGVEQSAWFRRQGLGREAVRGYLIETLSVGMKQFRIPPRELEEMLPQQLLMLAVAAKAWEDAGLDDGGNARAGVFVGLGLDLNTTNFHVRWAIQNKAREWAEILGEPPSGEAFDAWVDALRDAFGPPLTANRTMGALGSVVASRIARELRLGGPSFALSSEDGSGMTALATAMGALQSGEVDVALAGAVDLAADVRAALAMQGNPPLGEGAVALVLKRLDDARASDDRVYGVIKGMAACRDGGVDTPPGEKACRRSLTRALQAAKTDTDDIDHIEIHGGDGVDEIRALAEAFPRSGDETPRCTVGATLDAVGFSGAAAGLASVARALLGLHTETLPAAAPPIQKRLTETSSRLYAPPAPEHWLRDRARGPRRALVSALSLDGTCAHLVIEEAPGKDTLQADILRTRPLGAPVEALFIVSADGPEGLVAELDALTMRVEQGKADLDTLARQWWRDKAGRTRHGRTVAMVARATGELLEQAAFARKWLVEDPSRPLDGRAMPGQDSFEKDRIFYSPTPLGRKGKVAFVYPGSGNHYAGMGRELLARFPEVARAQDRENFFLRSQYQPDFFWRDVLENEEGNHKALIFGQVALGTAVTDLARLFGITPQAALGYSLGETAALFSLRAWRDRDAMLERINASNLFTTQLAGDCDAARERWGLPRHEAVDWVLGVIDRPMQVAKSALKNYKKVYPLIANTLQESVVGGNRKAVEKLIRKLECQFIPLSGVTTVHCEVVKEVEEAYRNLHLFDVTAPEGVKFYSGATGEAYTVTRESAADSILAQAMEGVDYPKVIESAHADGVRIFLEMGPGNSCSRMISKILGDEPHVARSLCHAGQDPVSLLLRGLAQVAAEGLDVDLAPLYGDATPGPSPRAADTLITVTPGGQPFQPPRPVRRKKVATTVSAPKPVPVAKPKAAVIPEPLPAPVPAPLSAPRAAGAAPGLVARMQAANAATVAAHAQYLAFTRQMTQTIAHALAGQSHPVSTPSTAPAPGDVAFDRDACMTFAIGKIADMLGPEYAVIDQHPTRVRLPDEPLMLVDRILSVEGERLSLTSGRVVTEHDVLPGAWYLDNERIPTCIAVEAGQADLFLSGYLGIDLRTRGRSVYRLLDADVAFHRGLPKPGETIRYDIRIERFFRHGNPWFFHFNFEGTVNGEPLITMRNGCAGFFTEAELAAGEGIVTAKMESGARPGVLPGDWSELAPMAHEAYDEKQLACLRRGDLAGCFGPAFADLPLRSPMRLPEGRMNLVHRVTELDPQGGRYGLGLIRAEADIHPEDWFLTCHFVDDRVMPGTLMYECCLHTLRIHLMRLGWVGEHDAVVCEPVTGVTSRLKCRGQVLETTKVVTYEVAIRELGYNPAPFAIADARMYADGKAIVEIPNMTVQFTGLTREAVEALWRDRTPTGVAERKPAVYDYDRILAFAVGKPSEAFGDRYRPFDEDRKIARLPGPPYDVLTRITEVVGDPWVMRAGTRTQAQYDIPADAWYFASNRQARMPFAVLLEVALQPCGWLAAYMGAALTSDEDLKFRNLGGKATQYLPVTAETGLLTVNIECTGVSRSGGMIIEHFFMEVLSPEGLVYRGTTYFGFFTHAALADQVGIREAVPYTPTEAERTHTRGYDFPAAPPFPDDTWRMIDRIAVYAPWGGPAGLGFIRGVKKVDPEEWFFKAHFYQDPVCPGSLGLESFLQLLKVVAADRWKARPDTQFETMALGEEHEWIYRGQIIPSDHEVTVEAVITRIDDGRRLLFADGFLTVDGRIIYQMKDFSLRMVTD